MRDPARCPGRRRHATHVLLLLPHSLHPSSSNCSSWATAMPGFLLTFSSFKNTFKECVAGAGEVGLCVTYCRAVWRAWQRTRVVGEEGELMLLALGAVTSDCHGKMTFRAGKPCNDAQSQGALGATGKGHPPGQAGEGPLYSHRDTRRSPVPVVKGSHVGAGFSPVQSAFSWGS